MPAPMSIRVAPKEKSPLGICIKPDPRPANTVSNVLISLYFSSSLRIEAFCLSKVEESYLANLGLLDEQEASTELVTFTKNMPRMKGEEINLEDINVRKDLYNKSNNNNKGISLKKQIEFYDAHVNNLYSQYKLKSKIKKIYDRLNSLYYNDAKASNMTVLDYIKSLNLEIGCKVEVIRSGEIIPRILRRVDEK